MPSVIVCCVGKMIFFFFQPLERIASLDLGHGREVQVSYALVREVVHRRRSTKFLVNHLRFPVAWDMQ